MRIGAIQQIDQTWADLLDEPTFRWSSNLSQFRP